MSKAKHLFKTALIFVVAELLAFTLSACGSSNYKTGSESSANGTAGKAAASSYSNPRWPTKDQALLHIPEEDRWYNTKNRIGEGVITCVGPVVAISYRQDVNGQPTYIEIGEKYPGTQGVTLIIWGEDRANFSDKLEKIKVGSWIDVSGEPYLYNGRVDIKCEYSGQIYITGR